MASQTQGIQQLLSAEKRAAEKVSEARKRKNRRLKQAKEEAQAEIEKYKKEREQQVGYIMDVAQKLAILLNPRVSTSPSKTGIEQREAIILCGKPSAVENVIQADSDDQ